MRFLIAFVLVLGLILQVSAQASPSGTPSVSVTPSFTNSGTSSWTNSRTPSWTSSNTNSVSSTVTGTGTGTGTASVTYPQPPAPTIDGNFCLNHIISICPAWTDPAGFSFNNYRLYIQLQGSTTISVITTSLNSLLVQGLTPSSSYNVFVQGEDTSIGVFSANSSVVVMTTAASDPKNDPSLDIQNFSCAKGTNAKSGRVDIVCTWTAAQDTVVRINFKCHCVSTVDDPLFVRKHYYGTKAASAVSVTFAINRASATCNIFARFYYARRPTTRHHFQLVV